MNPWRGALIALVAMVPITAFTTYISWIVLPVQVRWTAPWVCDAPYSDLFVVSDRAGKGTNYTTYCAGPRGERLDIGMADPYLILWGLYYLVLGPITSLIVYFRVSRH